MAMEVYAKQPKSWFNDTNYLRFLAEDPIEKIISELFKNTAQSFNKNYSFYGAEFMLTVISQSHRKLREKKIAIQALWLLVNGYDYKQVRVERSLVKSKTFKYSGDICGYVKQNLLTVAQNSEKDLNIFIRKLVETPIKIESLDTMQQTDFRILPAKQNEEANQENYDAGKLFYWRVLREKRPKLYALAKIQEHSDKTLSKPTILVDFRGIDREKDCDDIFERKMLGRVEYMSDVKYLETAIKTIEAIHTKTVTKKSLSEVFDNIVIPETSSKVEADKNEESEKAKQEQSQIKTLKEDLISKIKTKISEIKKDNTFDLFDTLEEFLANPYKKVLLIQGDAGTGKTLLLRLIEQKLWEKYHVLVKGGNAKNRNRLPLRIVLSEVRSFDKAVDEFLIQHGCDFDGIRDIKNEPAVILFDGYDEINQFINLYNLNKLETWKDAKVIITSRKENLTALKEDYILCFTPGNDKQKVLSHSLLGVGEEQIRKYFNAQAQENAQQIVKLEKKLSTLTGKNSNALPITDTARRHLEQCNKFAQSEKFEALVEFVAALEENLPVIEAIQKDIGTLKSDSLEVLPLVETYQKQLDQLKKMTNQKNIETLKTSIGKNISAMQKVENELKDLIGFDDRTREIEDAMKTIKKMTSFKRISKVLKAIIIKTKNRSYVSEIGEQCTWKVGTSKQAAEHYNSCVNEVTPEFIKEKTAQARLAIEEIKAYEQELKAANSDPDTQIIIRRIASIETNLAQMEQFTEFEKFKLPTEKLNEAFGEFRAIEDEFDCLYTPENVEKDNLQPSQSQVNSSDAMPDFEKLTSLVPKLEEYIKIFEEISKDLRVFESLFRDITSIRHNFMHLYLKPDSKKIEGYNSKIRNFHGNLNTLYELNGIFRFFIKSPHEDSLVRPYQSIVNRLKMLIYLWKAQLLLQTIEENVNNIQSSTDELRFPKTKEDSYLIQTLQKQVTILQGSNQDIASSVIQKLNDIIEEIKVFENEIRAIKDNSDEGILVIKTVSNEIDRLRVFSDPARLDSIIGKYKEIITSPLMLRMLVQTLIRFPAGAANKAELYRLFATIHFEREKDKLLQTEKIPPKFNIIDSFYLYSKDLAVNMFIKKTTSIQAKSGVYKLLGIRETEKTSKWSRFFDDNNVITKFSRRGAQIIEDDGVVRFVHKSIMEYFAARQFYDEIVDYDPDNLEDYDPCLARGSIVDQETAVYSFIKDIAQGQKKKGDKGPTLLEKKIMEIFNSTTLHKLYGLDLDNNFFYPNIFLILLLCPDLTAKFGQLEENSATVSMVDKIFNWIFSPSEASRKFVGILDKSSEANPTVFQNLQFLIQIHYHLVSKPNSRLKFEDRFTTANKSTKIKVKIFNKNVSAFYTAKDGALAENTDDNGFSWTLDAKLFIHGSQESIVIIKDGKSCFSLKPNNQQSSNPEPAQNDPMPFALNNSETPWDVRECKWILKTGLYFAPLCFTLTSMCDLSQTLRGNWTSIEDYKMMFSGLCSCDVHLKEVGEEAYQCKTCGIYGEKFFCEACKDNCHKGHKVEKNGESYGHCECRFMGCCDIANGCTARLNVEYKNHIMYRCNQCPDDKKNTVLCIACKKHHEKDCKHQNFEKVTDGDVCGCDCITSRTRIIAHGSQYYYLPLNNSTDSNKFVNIDEDEEDDDSD